MQGFFSIFRCSSCFSFKGIIINYTFFQKRRRGKIPIAHSCVGLIIKIDSLVGYNKKVYA